MSSIPNTAAVSDSLPSLSTDRITDSLNELLIITISNPDSLLEERKFFQSSSSLLILHSLKI